MATDNKLSNILHIFCSLTFEKYSELRNTKNLKDFSNASKFQQNYAKVCKNIFVLLGTFFHSWSRLKANREVASFPSAMPSHAQLKFESKKLAAASKRFQFHIFFFLLAGPSQDVFLLPHIP